jgi:nucleoside phosphorylase
MPTDVLIITAAKGEDSAVRSVSTRLEEPWGQCEDKPRGYNFDIWQCRVSRDGKKPAFRIVLAHAPAQREHATSVVASVLISHFQPFCVGMSGVCAGRPDKVNLGDVIIAEKVWKYDAGEINRQPDAAQAEHWPEIETYQLPMHWKPKAETFKCELPDNHQVAWGKRPEPIDGKAWRAHLGGVATGKDLVRDSTIWDRLAKTQNRKILGIDMEASAIGWVSEFYDVPRKIVVKGVMDHGDPSKNDECRLFAARAAAEVLIQFLRDNLDENNHHAWASKDLHSTGNLRFPDTLQRSSLTKALSLGWQLARYEFAEGSGVPEAATAAVGIRQEIENILLRDGLFRSSSEQRAQQVIRDVLGVYQSDSPVRHAAVLIGIAAYRCSLVGLSTNPGNNEGMRQIAMSAIMDIDPSLIPAASKKAYFDALLKARPMFIADLLDFVDRTTFA